MIEKFYIQIDDIHIWVGCDGSETELCILNIWISEYFTESYIIEYFAQKKGHIGHDKMTQKNL